MKTVALTEYVTFKEQSHRSPFGPHLSVVFELCTVNDQGDRHLLLGKRVLGFTPPYSATLPKHLDGKTDENTYYGIILPDGTPTFYDNGMEQGPQGFRAFTGDQYQWWVSHFEDLLHKQEEAA